MRRLLLILLLATTSALCQMPTTPAPTADPLAPLDFLLGTWSAATAAANGTAAATVHGNYVFRRDLDGHVLSRTGTPDACKGPAGFDCNHSDQLTIFSDPNAMAAHHASLLALYLDNEGHLIYYALTLPDPHTVIFNSVGGGSAPKFRLVYHLEGTGPRAVMLGKFQMAAPGSDEYHSYLEWSGSKQ